MKVLEYDEVLLFDGRKGIIIEVASDNNFRIDLRDTYEDIKVIELRIEEIEKVVSTID